jgi:hypothetical protein
MKYLKVNKIVNRMLMHPHSQAFRLRGLSVRLMANPLVYATRVEITMSMAYSAFQHM